MEILIQSAIFVISLFVLIKSADYFTTSAEKIGLFFGIPSFLVGVTIVALGTSLPELVSSIIAAQEGSTEIVAGNVIGSNIANIFLIIGVVAIIAKRMEVTYELIHVDLPLLIGSAFLLAATVWDGIFTWKEGLLCMAGILLYLCYTIVNTKEGHKWLDLKSLFKTKAKLGWHTPTILAISAIFIYLGAKYTIDSIINLSNLLNIGKEIIALSAVALGTSLPEMMVSISAAKKGNAEIAVGNVLGSNIFNSFVVMGIPSFMGTLTIPADILSFSLPMMLMATILYFFITQDKQITRWEGGMLVIFYVFFIGKLFDLL